MANFPKVNFKRGVKWVEKTFKFNECFIKSYIDDSDEVCFLEASAIIYPFCFKEWKLENFTNF